MGKRLKRKKTGEVKKVPSQMGRRAPLSNKNPAKKGAMIWPGLQERLNRITLRFKEPAGLSSDIQFSREGQKSDIAKLANE